MTDLRNFDIPKGLTGTGEEWFRRYTEQFLYEHGLYRRNYETVGMLVPIYIINTNAGSFVINTPPDIFMYEGNNEWKHVKK